MIDLRFLKEFSKKDIPLLTRMVCTLWGSKNKRSLTSRVIVIGEPIRRTRSPSTLIEVPLDVPHMSSPIHHICLESTKDRGLDFHNLIGVAQTLTSNSDHANKVYADSELGIH